jgi:RES domain-containing protein
MRVLPPNFGGGDALMWRLDRAEYSAGWSSGEGPKIGGGRWSSVGVRAVYCSLDPATAILEVAANRGFRTLDTLPHILTAAIIPDPGSIHIVDPASLPNPNWVRPGSLSAGQQSFGDELLAREKRMLVPSVVSTHSWNLVFLAAETAFTVYLQEKFALDTRLHHPNKPV